MSAAAPAARAPWLFGPGLDLLIGCGLLYALLIVPISLAGDAFMNGKPTYLLALGVVFFSASHYGATLLRVYERREDRRAYVLFSLYATLVIAAAFVAGLRSATWSAYLLTLYLTWSPWHYTGQNYGIAVMFVRRAGVPLPTGLKRLLYASFLCSYALTFVSMHAGAGTAWDPAGAGGEGVAFLSLGIPHVVARPVLIALLSLDALLVIASAALLVRAGSLRRVAPALALMLTQALWFTIPFGVLYLGVHTGLAALDRQQEIRDYLLLVAIAHGTQYLWVTAYYAKQRASHWSGLLSFYGKILFAGVALWTLPVVLFAPLRTGGMGYDSGLALLLASCVNLHHFVLDGAIWKLPQSRVASVLIRSTPEAPSDDTATPDAPWGRRAVWAVCAAGFACWAFVFQSLEFASPAARRSGDLAAQDRILQRIEWLGHDHARLRLDLANRFAHAHDYEHAESSYQRVVALEPTWKNYRAFARFYELRGDVLSAERVYTDAEAAVGPQRDVVLARSLLAFQRGDYAAADTQAARVLAANPQDTDVMLILSKIAAAWGDEGAALAHAQEAWRRRPQELAVASHLAWMLATTPDAELRDGPEALRVLEAALPDPEKARPEELDTLAACQAASGRFEDAVRTARRAVAAARESRAEGYAEQIRARLVLYESGRPYVEERRDPNASRSANTTANASAAIAP
jgi:tetratricopeptide (TPR) repeat protein